MASLPIGHEIKFGTPLHEKIRNAVWNRYAVSKRRQQERYDAWKAVDEMYRLYMPTSNEDRIRAAKRTTGQVEYTTLVVPYSYATLLAAHSYYTSVFLSRSPVHQFTGRHGESQQSIQALEALIDYQVMVGEHITPYYIWLLDTVKYGIGIVGCYWCEDRAVIPRIEVFPKNVWEQLAGKATGRKKVFDVVEGYAGHRVFNVRPHDFFPDPRVSLVNFQKGEFCGRLVSSVGWNELRRREFEGEYFNLDVLKDRINSQSERESLTSTDSLPGIDTIEEQLSGPGGKDFVELIEMVIELQPNEWGLGQTSYPEKWIFTLAGGMSGVVIGCRPLGEFHNCFPYQILLHEIEGYGNTTRGMMEVCKPLNEALEWLLNSHMFNVRKALNDQFIVDPSRVVMKDLLDGGPGKLIRLNPAFYGTDVRTVITQLATVDVTRGHLADMQIIAEIIQRATGVTDNIMGLVNSGGRKTATEVRTSSTFGINRLKTQAEYFSSMGWSRLAQMLVQGSQQHYDSEKMFRIVGDLLQNNKFIEVTPESISGFYNYVPVDGTLPIDRFAQANLWKEILMGLAKAPQIAMQYDVAGIFSWMAQLAGLKNITQFRIQVSPDKGISDMLASGNILPVGGENGTTNNPGSAIGPLSPAGLNGGGS